MPIVAVLQLRLPSQKAQLAGIASEKTLDL
jgi:hypothetical protein